MSEFPTPITVAFDGRTRQRFESVVEDAVVTTITDRARTRLTIETVAEAQALLNVLEGQNLLAFEPNQWPTLYRVRDELLEGLDTRGYAVDDGAVHEQELLADGGRETAEVPADTGDDLVDATIEAACANGAIGKAARIRMNAQEIIDDAANTPLVTTEVLPSDLASTMTSVYAHREEHDEGDTDLVFCSTAMVTPSIEEAAVPCTGSTIEWVETQVFAEFDGEGEALDELLPTEAERKAAGDIPALVGRLFIEGGRVVALELREEAFEEQEKGLVTDGGIPQSFEDLAATCESCGETVDPDRLIEGECPGCHYRPMADGGLYTVEHDGTEYAVCHMVAYDEDADLDVDYSGEDPVVTNHDEVQKHDEVRLLKVDDLRDHGGEHMAISPQDSLWRDSFEFLEPGDTIRLDDEEPVTDGGGVTWTDLTGFQRDCLEAIRRLETDGETVYGLAIKRELERQYGEEILHGRLYPNLDDLVDADLIEKGELDNRTNSYDLTAEGTAMVEQRARLLADACGMEQPVADGGDAA